jgi:hypothetical protein
MLVSYPYRYPASHSVVRIVLLPVLHILKVGRVVNVCRTRLDKMTGAAEW